MDTELDNIYKMHNKKCIWRLYSYFLTVFEVLFKSLSDDLGLKWPQEHVDTCVVQMSLVSTLSDLICRISWFRDVWIYFEVWSSECTQYARSLIMFVIWTMFLLQPFVALSWLIKDLSVISCNKIQQYE